MSSEKKFSFPKGNKARVEHHFSSSFRSALVISKMDFDFW